MLDRNLSYRFVRGQPLNTYYDLNLTLDPWDFGLVGIACVASVSSRVVARKLGREQKNERGRGRGEEETLAHKPYDSAKRPLIFQSSVHL